MILKVMLYAESSAIKMFHFEKSSNMQKKNLSKIMKKILIANAVKPNCHFQKHLPQKKFSTFMYERDPYAHIIGLIILLRRAPSSACCFEFEFNGFL